MLVEVAEHLIKGIVEHPDDVDVEERTIKGPRPGRLIQVRVHPLDMGRVIGRSGRTATALRRVVNALADGRSVRIDFVDVTER
ncbi:MAG: RNA-binding protein [Candidatus Nanopelagicales bacterium]|nr:RNA-binding protein [Candidatus Nanopelagicales bacterium]